jgi:hypothetical protein
VNVVSNGRDFSNAILIDSVITRKSTSKGYSSDWGLRSVWGALMER